MENCQKDCSICSHGKCRKSGGVYCTIKKRLLLSNRANDCEDYNDKYEVRSLKKRGKFEEETKYETSKF